MYGKLASEGVHCCNVSALCDCAAATRLRLLSLTRPVASASHTPMQVAAAVGAWHVYCNRRYEPAPLKSDERVWTALAAQGFCVHTFRAALLRCAEAARPAPS